MLRTCSNSSGSCSPPSLPRFARARTSSSRTCCCATKLPSSSGPLEPDRVLSFAPGTSYSGFWLVGGVPAGVSIWRSSRPTPLCAGIARAGACSVGGSPALAAAVLTRLSTRLSKIVPRRLNRRLALYTRLSDDDADSVSHAHQEHVARAWADQHGYTIVATYRDWRTGFDPNRLALAQFIEDAHAGKHGDVVVYDHYRFHRGVTGAYPVVMLHNQVPAYSFHAASGSYDVDHIGIWAGISGLEAATTRRRSTDQRRYRASLGQLVSGRWPYWLERDPASRLPRIVPHRAAALLEAIAQYANGARIRLVVAWLNEHAPPGGDARCWTSQRFRKALRNPALWGRLDYARQLPLTERRHGELVTVGYTANPDAVRLEVPPLIHRTELERSECRIAGGCERDFYPAADTLDTLITSNGGRAAGRP